MGTIILLHFEMISVIWSVWRPKKFLFDISWPSVYRCHASDLVCVHYSSATQNTMKKLSKIESTFEFLFCKTAICLADSFRFCLMTWAQAHLQSFVFMMHFSWLIDQGILCALQLVESTISRRYDAMDYQLNSLIHNWMTTTLLLMVIISKMVFTCVSLDFNWPCSHFQDWHFLFEINYQEDVFPLKFI